jgi:hypothetical protein
MQQLNLFMRPYVKAIGKHKPEVQETLNGWYVDEQHVSNVLDSLNIDALQDLAEDEEVSIWSEVCFPHSNKRNPNCKCTSCQCGNP